MPYEHDGPGPAGIDEVSAQDSAGDLQHLMRSLIPYALLAPSSHNSEPWKFRVGNAHVDVFADSARWLRIADADRREMYLSLGCALENLLVSAEHFGLRYELMFQPGVGASDWVARVNFARGRHRSRPPELFDAIPVRRTNRRLYTGAAVPEGVLSRLRECVKEDGVRLWTSADPIVQSRLARLVMDADRIEYANPEFRRELGDWVGRGAFRTPRPLRPLARVAVTHIDRGRAIGRRDAALVHSSGAVAVVLASSDSPETQIRAGMALQRVWLLATSLGVAMQPMSAPLEIPQLRSELSQSINAVGARPVHLFRLGFARSEKRPTPRRALSEVIASG